MTTTSAIDSRQVSSLEWCSNGPMKTTGRWFGGIASVTCQVSSRFEGTRRPITPISLSIA